jgi:transcriptional regulator with XRE-family HTH domain
MKTRTRPSTKATDSLARLGERIRLARVRRRITSALLAERIGVSHSTMTAIERGAPGVAVGHYASALFSLGLLADLDHVAQDDELGRRLQDLDLPKRVNLPKNRKEPNRG